jgi:hypothetical protein
MLQTGEDLRDQERLARGLMSFRLIEWVPRGALRSFDRKAARVLTGGVGAARVSRAGALRSLGLINLDLTGQVQSAQADSVEKAAVLRAVAVMHRTAVRHRERDNPAAGSPGRILADKGEPNQASVRDEDIRPRRNPDREAIPDPRATLRGRVARIDLAEAGPVGSDPVEAGPAVQGQAASVGAALLDQRVVAEVRGSR